MITIVWYLLKVVVCSGILLGYYWIALRNKLFHHYNRFYLLCTIILSIILPFVQINFWHTNAQSTNAIKVIEAVSFGNSYITDEIVNTAPIQKIINWQLLYPIFYSLVSIVLLIGFIKMLFKIRTLLEKYPTQKVDEVTFINTENERGTPFSFLKFIFWNKLIDTSTPQGNQIFKHELAHIKEKHTYDKLFINIILIVYWLNPFFWLLRKELNLLHEFIADKKAVEDGDTGAFAAMLLQTIYPQHQFSIANNFFYSPIKRRLIMLTKIKNPKVNYLGRILVLPLMVLLLAAFTFKVNKHNNHVYKGKKVTVVIDAGHGGERDPGAISFDGTTEKELNLALAKRIKELNTNNSIEIILTRETDVYQSPKEKADFANNLGADLLVAVHIDRDAKPTTTIKSGMNIFVAKNDYTNAVTSKAFGSYMLQSFTNNYKLPVPNSTTQRGVGIWIIKESNCPSILVEAGYINNENDLAFLKSQEGQNQFAKNILNGIENYLNQNINTAVQIDTVPKTLPTEQQWEKAALEAENDLNKKPSVSISSEKGKVDFYGDKKNIVRTKDNPLYIVDGIILSKEEMEKLSPNSIDKIDILKGESATKLYGDKGKNGVVVITTKNSQKQATQNLNKQKASNNMPDMLYIVNGLQTVKDDVAKINTDDIIDVRILNAKDAIPTYGDKAQNGVMILNVKQKSNFILETMTLDGDAVKNVGKNPYIEVNGKQFNDNLNTLPKESIKHIKIIANKKAMELYGDKAKDGAILVTTTK